jgi:hypothetical protein
MGTVVGRVEDRRHGSPSQVDSGRACYAPKFRTEELSARAALGD